MAGDNRNGITAPNTLGVQRYDGETRASLGSFMSGMGHVYGLALDQTHKRIFSLVRNLDGKGGTSGVTLYSYNYNTGEYLNEIRLGSSVTSAQSIATDGKFIWVGSGGGVSSYDASSLVYQGGFSVSGAGAIYGLACDPNRVVIRDQNNLYVYNTTGSYLSGIGLGAITTSAALAMSGDRVVLGDTVGRFRFSVASNVVNYLGSYSVPQYNTTSYSTQTGLAFGHGDRFYASAYDTTSASQVVQGFSFTNGTYSGSSSLMGAQQGPLVNVVAPEPASYVALALGCGALVRRRRR